MRTCKAGHSDGFTLVEVMMVMAIVGALISIALPNYLLSRLKALAAQCHSNRYNIEQDERNYFLDNGTASLNIDKRYSCPSGGIYVWLISDPDDPDYPKIACSVHYAGVDVPPQTAPASGPVAPEDTTTTPASAKLIDDLIVYVLDINLQKGTEQKLVSKLNNIKKSLEKGGVKKVVKEINDFIDQVKKDKNITAEEADRLVSKAQGIIETI